MAREVLISGAGIAGPALALWLGRKGFRVTVVEQAAALRRGGQAVDFRGPAHMRVLEAMGLVDALRERATRMGPLRFVDARGRGVFTLPASFASGELEVERGDLVALLHERSRDEVAYVFGDTVTALAQDDGGVDVTFQHGRPRRFDFVVGADGLHSRVRALAFGPEERFVTHLGYAIAVVRAPNVFGLDHEGVVVSEPGRAVSVSSARRADECVAMFVHAGRALRDAGALHARFADMGGQAAKLLPYLVEGEVFVDDVARVDVDGFARGRVVLLGDAAAGATVGGQGTGVAVVGAYVLAGELERADDPAIAFARYEAAVARWARGCQDTAKHMGPFFAPRTRAGLALRNAAYRALTSRPLAGVLARITAAAASDIQVPTYA